MSLLSDPIYTPQGRWWHRFWDAIRLAWVNYRQRRNEVKEYDSWIEDIDRLAHKDQA